MWTTRRFAALLLLTIMAMLSAGVQPRAAASESAEMPGLEVTDLGDMADIELLESLQAAGLLHAWFENASHSPATAMLDVDVDSSYEALRAETILAAQELAAAIASIAELDDRRTEGETLDSDLVTLITAPSLDGEALADNDKARSANNEAALQLVFQIGRFGIDVDDARESLQGSLRTLQSLRANATTVIDDLPIATIDAYVSAANGTPAGCGVTWTLLAGIGRIESLHGTLGGASVSADGQTSPRIFGPLLDGGATERQIEEEAAAADQAALEAEEEGADKDLGAVERYPELYKTLLPPTPEPEEPEPEEAKEDSDAQPNGVDGDSARENGDSENGDEAEEEAEEEGNGFAVIEDTDGGELDGNPDWDRAVGPMQFIPGTWKLFNTDGNGDGWADPHNLYDAAASAANYLCHLEQRNGPDPSVFIRGYNDSRAYVADVIETSDRLSANYVLPTVTEQPADERSDQASD